jgi:serine/threonine protein kinase
MYRRLQMLRDAALGMNWLHCSKPVIIHRDLKPSNLLVTTDG